MANFSVSFTLQVIRKYYIYDTFSPSLFFKHLIFLNCVQLFAHSKLKAIQINFDEKIIAAEFIKLSCGPKLYNCNHAIEGWLCPNIYFLGNCGVVDLVDKTGEVALTIGGLSGIFKGHDYLKVVNLWGKRFKLHN